MKELLRRQWVALRAWLEEVEIDAYEERRTGLPPWTIRDLVAHLGYGLHLSVDVRAAPSDAVPLSLGDYVSQYPPAAAAISRSTQELAKDMPTLLGGVDAMATRAFNALDQLDDVPIVQARRGPLTREDYLRTRLIELVVHGDDLHQALPAATRTPLLAEAKSEVASTLASAYEARAGRQAPRQSELGWIRAAVGRMPTSDPHLPLM